MRRIMLSLAALSVALPLLAGGPASAHAAWNIVGYTYTAVDGGNVGTGGYLLTREVGEGFSDDGIGSVTNRDPVRHTFTHCTADCEGGSPKAEGALFDASLDTGSQASYETIETINSLPSGTYWIFCRIHPGLMRAKLILTTS